MKKTYVERAQIFVSEIFDYIEESIKRDYVRDSEILVSVERYAEDHHRRVLVKGGMSRVALISSDYVIKIDRRKDSFCGSSIDEIRGYQFACEHGYGYLFAAITPFNYKGYDFFIMPRVRNINPYRDDDEKDYYLTDDEMEFLGSYYDDLHSGNYGFMDGKPVIVDYAWNSTL